MNYICPCFQRRGGGGAPLLKMSLLGSRVFLLVLTAEKIPVINDSGPQYQDLWHRAERMLEKMLPSLQSKGHFSSSNCSQRSQMQLVRVAFTIFLCFPTTPFGPPSHSPLEILDAIDAVVTKTKARSSSRLLWSLEDVLFLARERVGHPVFFFVFFFETSLLYAYSLIIRRRPNEMFLRGPWERFFLSLIFFQESRKHPAMMDDKDRRCWNASTFTAAAAAQLEKPTRFFFLTRLQLAPSLCFSAREQSCCSCSSMSKSWGEGAKVSEMPKDNKQKVSLQKGLGGFFFVFVF